MAIEVASWNAHKSLSNTEGTLYSTHGFTMLAEGIGRLASADMIFVSEVFVSDRDDSLIIAQAYDAMRDIAASNGYDVVRNAAYGDANRQRQGAGPQYDHHMTLLGRSAVVQEASLIRLGERNAFAVEFLDIETDTPVSGVAAHFDDRSEVLRIQMADNLVYDHVVPAQMAGNPFFAIGDFNSMHRRSKPARFWGSAVVGKLAPFAPSERARSIATRLHELGDGATMDVLQFHNLSDADPTHQPTLYHGPIPLGQVDHLFTESLNVADFRRHKLSGSDHRAISAKISPDILLAA